jgi:hypothetical protein
MQVLLHRARLLAIRARLPEWFWPARARLGDFGVYPALPVSDDLWEPLDPAVAAVSQMRVILPVRAGEPLDGWSDRVPRNLHGMPLSGTAMDVEALRHGADIIDLLAFDHSMARPPRRLIGIARALGPQPEMAECRAEPVRLARDLPEWFALLPEAPVLLLGGADERAETLREYACGVVCSDLKHGEAMERLSRRPVPAPLKILVAA